jgi:hypothetical protein
LNVGAAPVAETPDRTTSTDPPAPAPAATSHSKDVAKNIAALGMVRDRLLACAMEWRQVGTFELSVTFPEIDVFGSFSGVARESPKLSYREFDASGHAVRSQQSPQFLECLQDAMPAFPTRTDFSYRLTVRQAVAGDSPSTSPASLSSATACDAEALRQAGIQAWAAARYASAVSSLEKAYACKPDVSVLRLMTLGACKIGDPAKARQLFARIPAPDQAPIVQACLMEHGIRLQ